MGAGEPAPGASGVQNDVQAPLQRTLPSASWSGVYSALPEESARTFPTPSTCLTETVLVPPVEVVPPLALVPLPPLDPQAASTRPAVTTAEGISSRFIA